MKIIVLLIAFLFFGSAAHAGPEISSQGTFPTLHIKTTLPIDRHIWGDAVVTIDSAEENFRFEGLHAQIRGRGNSSWRLEKRPFRLRFEEPREMLDSGHAARDWTFIANHSDKALMRNYSAYYLASQLDGMYFAPFARFIDVYFNGEYQGVYMLSIQVQVNEGRAELTYNSDPALSEFLFEMDYHVSSDYDSIEGVTYIHVNGRDYDILFPSRDRLTSAHVEYLRNYIIKVENLFMAQDSTVFQYIHMPFFVDFYIVQEFFKNVDVESSSVFMQIRGQGEERRLEMGPVWDFDIAAGNAHFQGDTLEDYPYYYSPHGLWAGWVHLWYRNLLQMPEFFDAVADRWNDVKDGPVRQTINRINFMALRYQAAFERNFERWPILGVYVRPNPQRVVEIDTFLGQVEYLVDFLETRKIGFSDFFNSGRQAE